MKLFHYEAHLKKQAACRNEETTQQNRKISLNDKETNNNKEIRSQHT